MIPVKIKYLSVRFFIPTKTNIIITTVYGIYYKNKGWLSLKKLLYYKKGVIVTVKQQLRKD